MRALKACIATLLLAANSYAALSALTQLNVQTDGTDTNGAGFTAGGTGTNYSLFANKNAAGCTSCGSSTVDLSTTDAVAAGTTTITSVTANFQTTIVDNVVYFAGGTGTITGQWRRVTARASTTSITIDASIAISTGMTMNIGGALLTNAQAAAVATVAGMTVNLKAGTYTITSVIAITVGTITWRGYGTTPGDGGTKPLITTSTNSTVAFSTVSTSGVQLWDNISFSNTAGTKDAVIRQTNNHGTTSQQWIIRSSKISGGTRCIDSSNIGSGWDVAYITIEKSEITGCTTVGVDSNAGVVYIDGSYFHANAVSVNTNTSSLALTIAYSIFGDDTDTSVNVNSVRLAVYNSTFVAATNKAVFPSNSLTVYATYRNNLMYGNDYGIFYSGGTLPNGQVNITSANNCFKNTNGNLGYSGVGDITMTVDPFTNLAAKDYSLNSTAGGGAACRSAGYPGVFPAGLTTGGISIGAAIPSASAGASQTARPIQ